MKLITVPLAPLPKPEALIMTVKFSARTGAKEINARTEISMTGMRKDFLPIFQDQI
jgi:hypothetical protein